MKPTYEIRLDKEKLETIIRRAPQKAGQAVRALALEGERIVKMSFNTSPPGRSYRHGGVTHVASQPDHPPNIDTGKLMNAIHVENRGPFTQAITTGDTEYAVYQEFGTTDMEARPFMAPMAEALRGEVGRIFDGFLED